MAQWKSILCINLIPCINKAYDDDDDDDDDDVDDDDDDDDAHNENSDSLSIRNPTPIKLILPI